MRRSSKIRTGIPIPDAPYLDRKARDPKALELFHNVEEVKRWAAGFMKARAVWRFFEAERDGNAIRLFAPGALHTFHFGRQPKEDGLCLSDYVLDPEDGRRDHVAIFVVTARATAASATASATAPARTSTTGRASGSCSAPKTSASI